MMKRIASRFVIFLIIFLLLFLTKGAAVDTRDILFNIALSVFTTMLIDFFVVELPRTQKIRKINDQLETINCFYVLTFYFMLEIHRFIYIEKKKTLSELTEEDVKEPELAQAFEFLKKFSSYIQSENSNYANIDNLIKINTIATDVDEVWQYSRDVSRFYECFFSTCNSTSFELELTQKLAYSDSNPADYLYAIMKDIIVLNKYAYQKKLDWFSSLVLVDRRYFAGYDIPEVKGYLKEWEQAKTANYLE